MTTTLTPQRYAKVLYDLTDELPDQKMKDVIDEFIKFLANQNALAYVDTIIAEFVAYTKKIKGISDVEVTTAHKLDLDLEEKLKEVFGEKLDISYKVNPSLIGGLKIKVNNTVFDGSMKHQVDNLRTQLHTKL